MEQLVLRLGSHPSDPIYWLVWSTEQDEIIASGELPDAQSLSSLTERAGKRPVTALVPGSDVYLREVALPAKASRKVLTAIPYMLEEELSEDISKLFFALGDKHNTQQPVAVVARDKITAWLTQLSDAGLTCDRLIPDILALPPLQGQWSMLSLGDQLLVRQGHWEGLQGHQSWVLPAIEHHAKQLPEGLVLASFSQEDMPNLANVTHAPQPLEVPMLVLAKQAITSPINLLQGDFKPKQKQSYSLGRWRWAAILFGLALGSSLVDRGIELYQLNQQSAQLKDDIAAEYQRGFANSGSYRNLRRKVQDNLAALERTGGGISMLVILSQLSDAFDDTGVKPQTLRFDSGRAELRMLAEAANFEALEQFKRMVEAQGFEIEQGAINNRDNLVVSSLSIRS